MSQKPKRIAFFGDTHCGHELGLTPKKYWQGEEYPSYQHQKALWEWFDKQLKKVGQCDAIVFNGDLIDGSGKRCGGSEHIFTSELKQVEIATYVVRHVMNRLKCNKVYMTYGTAYHTGESNDFEDVVASNVGATIASQLFLDFNGKIFDIKHHTTGGRGTPGNYGSHGVKKESVVNNIVSQLGHEPKAEVTIRSHIHIYRCDKDAHGASISLPALQWAGTKYGARRCFGHVDVGFLIADVTKDCFLDQPILAKLDLQQKRVHKA